MYVKNTRALHATMSVTEITGNLLHIDDGIIVQQLNCQTVRPHGLSQVIAHKYPYANVYAQRAPVSCGKNRAQDEDEPGGVVISYPPEGQKGPIVVGLLAQYAPGKPGRYAPLAMDDPRKRQTWFRTALFTAVDILEENGHSPVTLHVPYTIGCGLAGGDWRVYCRIIEEVAHETNVDIVIVRLPGAV